MKLDIHRFLTDPDAKDREILKTEIAEPQEPANVSGQISFLNGLAGDLDARVVHISKNTDQKLIVVTQDKTLLTLKKNLALLGTKDWVAPLSTVTTIFLTLLTSNFRYAIGLGPSEWRAIFIVSGMLAVGWLGYSVRKAIHAKTFHEVVTDIVHELGNRRRANIQI